MYCQCTLYVKHCCFVHLTVANVACCWNKLYLYNCLLTTIDKQIFHIYAWGVLAWGLLQYKDISTITSCLFWSIFFHSFLPSVMSLHNYKICWKIEVHHPPTSIESMIRLVMVMTPIQQPCIPFVIYVFLAITSTCVFTILLEMCNSWLLS